VRYRFADCDLDREARTLVRAGRPVRAQELVLDLLLLLLQHRGRVVSEDFVRRRLWPDVAVGDAALRRVVKEARRAIGDDGERQAFIQTVRGRGFRWSAPVGIEDGWDTSFVGRADVLAALEHKLEEVAGGLGGLTLLHGPAGIGKTRALAEIEVRAGMRGFRVLHGSGRPEAEGDAFHPWLDVARELGIEEILPSAPQTPIGDAAQADARRYAGFRAVSTSLSRAARERPLLIALDDLQLADRDGLEALRFLAPALVRAPVWIIGVYRTGSGPRTEDALRALASLGAETTTQELPLRGLASDEIRMLLANHVRAEVGMPLTTLLADHAGGNPLFSLEIARSLQRDGRSLEAEPGSAFEAELARGIGPLLERRLSAIPAEALRLLGAAAALGHRFDAEIAAAAEDLAPDAAERALDACATAALVERDAASQWRFGHPLVAESVYARLEAAGGASAQHARVADACQRLGIDDPFLLAHHLRKARPVVDAATALGHVHAAAREALRRSALADAVFWYRAAVELADEAGLPDAALYDLLMEQGDASVALAGTDEARPSLERAAQLALAAKDRDRLARAALAYAHRPSAFGASARVLHWLRASQSLPCEDRGMQARIASRLGSELFFAGTAHAAEARAQIALGVAIARELGDPAALAPVLLDQSLAELSARDTRGWLDLVEEVERHGRACGDLESAFRGLAARAAGLLELGDRDGVESVERACRRFLRDHPNPYAGVVTRSMEVMLALLDGRWADAHAGIEAAERDLRASASAGFALLVAVQRMFLAIDRGEVGSLLPAADRLVERFGRVPAVAAFVGTVRAQCGDLASGRAALAAFLDGLPSLAFDRNRLPGLVVAAELAHRVGARDAAAALESELAPFSQVGAVLGNTAAAYMGSVSHALGWTAAARGDVRAAVQRFQKAVHDHESLRSPPWSARSTQAIATIRRLRVVGGSATPR
jgi:DNA-binding winged helix-turn-helix (wHTH) protein